MVIPHSSILHSSILHSPFPVLLTYRFRDTVADILFTWSITMLCGSEIIVMLINKLFLTKKGLKFHSLLCLVQNNSFHGRTITEISLYKISSLSLAVRKVSIFCRHNFRAASSPFGLKGNYLDQTFSLHQRQELSGSLSPSDLKSRSVVTTVEGDWSLSRTSQVKIWWRSDLL